MSALTTHLFTAAIPLPEDFSFSAGEIELAAEMTAHGIWHVWLCSQGFPPVWCGTTDTRAKAARACQTPDDYICLLAHNRIHNTTDDPTPEHKPYLCYPCDPQYRIQNARDAELFGALECEGKAKLKAPVTHLLHETLEWMAEVRQAAGLHP